MQENCDVINTVVQSRFWSLTLWTGERPSLSSAVFAASLLLRLFVRCALYQCDKHYSCSACGWMTALVAMSLDFSDFLGVLFAPMLLAENVFRGTVQLSSCASSGTRLNIQIFFWPINYAVFPLQSKLLRKHIKDTKLTRIPFLQRLERHWTDAWFAKTIFSTNSRWELHMSSGVW